MKNHSRSKSNKPGVGYRTPSRFKAENPQAAMRENAHEQRLSNKKTDDRRLFRKIG